MRSALALAMVLIGFAAITVATATFDTGSSQTQLPSTNGVLFTTETPVVPPYAGTILRRLSRATTFAQLESKTSDQTRLIVIDSCALPEVPRTFLRQQVARGVTVMAINVTVSDLIAASDYASVVSPSIPPGVPTDLLAVRKPYDEPFYSFVSVGVRNGRPVTGGMGQKDFRGTAKVSLFKADLERHLTP